MRIAWKLSVLECFFIIIKFQQKKRIRLKKDTKKMPLWNPSNIEELLSSLHPSCYSFTHLHLMRVS